MSNVAIEAGPTRCEPSGIIHDVLWEWVPEIGGKKQGLETGFGNRKKLEKNRKK